MMLRTLLAAAALACVACSQQSPPDAAAESAAFDQAAAEAEILAWARGLYGAQLIEPVFTAFGDFSGDGAPDALAIAYYDMGGSGAGIAPALFRNEGGRMSFLREVEIFGVDPRDARFAPGQVTVTTLMPGPNDPHCCPTEPQEWTVSTEAN